MLTIDSIKEIEMAAYPSQFLQMQDAESWQDIADYCECKKKKLVILGDESWYAIVAKHRNGYAEFVDIAKKPNSPMVDWGYILKELLRNKIRKVSADMRHDTSYKILKRKAEAFGVKILKDKQYFDECFEEDMHEVLLKLNKEEK